MGTRKMDVGEERISELECRFKKLSKLKYM